MSQIKEPQTDERLPHFISQSISQSAPQSPLISSPLIVLHNLTLYAQHSPILAIDQLHLPKNGIFAILGPSGCGKSSLLKLLAGLNEPELRYTGEIRETVTEPLRYAMVWQTPTVFPCSVRDNLWAAYRSRLQNTLTNPFNKDGLTRLYRRLGTTFARRTKEEPEVKGQKRDRHKTSKTTSKTGQAQHNKQQNKQDRHDIENKLYSALRKVGLDRELGDQWASRSANTLSGGQKQRLRIAMGLLKQADVLLLDEPTSSLDPISTKEIEKTVLSLSKAHLIVLVTHSIGQAKRLSDYATVLCHCADRNMSFNCETGPAQQVLKSPRTPACRAFIEAEIG